MTAISQQVIILSLLMTVIYQNFIINYLIDSYYDTQIINDRNETKRYHQNSIHEHMTQIIDYILNLLVFEVLHI